MIFDVNGLLEPQKEHGRFLANSLIENGMSFDATVMGGGKTYTGAALGRFLLQNSNRKIVVICPRKVSGNWEKTLAQFGIEAKLIINLETLVRGKTKWLKYRRATKQENADGIKKMMLAVLKFPSDWFIILDEVHRCKGTTSLSAGALMAIKRQGYQFHITSGTAATSPLDMRALGYALGLHDGTMREFKKFCMNAGAVEKGHHGAMVFVNDCPVAKAKMKQVHHYIFDDMKMGSRLERSDFKGIFPNNQIIAEALDMGDNTDRIQAAYEEMDAEIARIVERENGYSEHIFAVMIAARKKIEMLKVPTLVEIMEDSYEAGRTPLLFVSFTDTIEAVYKRLSHIMDPALIGLIYGERTERQQLEDIEMLAQDKRRAIIANLASGGESVNMQDFTGVFPREGIINVSWNAIKVVQAACRHDRAHAKSDCITRFPFADKTVEVPICQRFQSRKDNMDLLNNGDLCPSERIFNLGGGMNI
jgi:hypothetical protein